MKKHVKECKNTFDQVRLFLCLRVQAPSNVNSSKQFQTYQSSQTKLSHPILFNSRRFHLKSNLIKNVSSTYHIIYAVVYLIVFFYVFYSYFWSLKFYTQDLIHGINWPNFAESSLFGRYQSQSLYQTESFLKISLKKVLKKQDIIFVGSKYFGLSLNLNLLVQAFSVQTLTPIMQSKGGWEFCNFHVIRDFQAWF